jgi:hypothetical protein
MRMQLYRFRWLACFAVAACLIVWATPQMAGRPTQSSQTGIGWNANPDAAILARISAPFIVRCAPKPEPDTFKCRYPTVRGADGLAVPAGRFYVVGGDKIGSRRGSDYLERSHDNPRAPPHARDA